jgi:hypothetical protein
MIAPAPILLAAALAAATPARAQPPAQQQQGFSGLWTQWSNANSASVQAETSRQAPAAQPGPLRAGSPELGARVGEIVRAGDCEEGERVARAAGDFPLVEAVRAHCRPAIQAVSRH